MKVPLILIGGGGHCKSIIDIIETNNLHEVRGIIEADKNKVGQFVLGKEIIGVDADLALFFQKYRNFIITVGQIKNATLRIKLFDKAINLGGIPTSVFSGNAHISKYSTIGRGVSVGHFSTVNAGSYIGDNTIINNHVLLEHDSKIGNNCHIATSSVINGDVTIGNSVFIGSNSTVIQGVSICSDCIIGAGSIVTKNIEEPGIYLGTPAKRIK